MNSGDKYFLKDLENESEASQIPRMVEVGGSWCPGLLVLTSVPSTVIGKKVADFLILTTESLVCSPVLRVYFYAKMVQIEDELLEQQHD